jgi:ComF family protein
VDIECGECQKRPPKYVRAHAAYHYAPPIDRLIHGLKYQGKLHYARVLGNHLAQHLDAARASRPDAIIPVPLHRSRLRERGYNQALEIARPLARCLNVPVHFDHIYRVRPTATQAELPRKKRRGNVRNAFQIDRDYSGMSVSVVDDVMTTGSTVDSFAACLRRAGAESISIWVVARA